MTAVEAPSSVHEIPGLTGLPTGAGHRHGGLDSAFREENDLLESVVDELLDVAIGGRIFRGDFNAVLERHRLPARLYLRVQDRIAAAGLTVTESDEGVDEEDGDDGDAGWDGDGFTVFLDRARHRILTAEEEVELGKRMERGELARRALAETGTWRTPPEAQAELRRQVADGEDAKNEFARSNLRLVVKIASRFQNRGLPLEDLVQEGWLGLSHAIEKFDYRRGFKFSTYATWWIRQSLQRAVDNYGRTIRLPVHAADTLRRVMRTDHELRSRLGRAPSLIELAEACELNPGTVQLLLSYRRNPDSLDRPIGDGTARVADRVEDPAFPAPEDEAERADRTAWVHRLLDELTPRERRVLTERYGLSGADGGAAKTLEEIGLQFGLTRERIRQIEARALKRLRSVAGNVREAY